MSGFDGLDPSLMAAAGPAAGLLLPSLLRALRGAAAALLPNLLLAAFLVVFLAIAQRAGGLALAVIVLIGLSVAMDDLRGFLRTYRDSFRGGAEPAFAIRCAMRRLIRPLVMTLVTGLGGLALVLAFAGTPAATAGSLALLLTGLALGADALLLPIGLICCREQ